MGGGNVAAERVWRLDIVHRQTSLWLLAVLFYGVGDTATTLLGLQSSRIAEAGPVALAAMDVAGHAGFLLVKLGFVGACFAVWWILETPGRVAIPLALLVAGIGVTGWNVAMLLL